MSPNPTGRVLLIEDDAQFRTSLARLLGREGFETREAASIAAGRAQLIAEVPDVVLLDLDLPDGRGLDLKLDDALPPETPFIVISGDGSAASARTAMREGASDYLTKPVDAAELKAVLHAALRQRALAAEVSHLRRALQDAGRFGQLVGRSPAMRRVYDLIERVAPTGVPVLVSGESGTGKELVAHTVHELSARAAGPLVVINCGAIPETLIESKLFGHEKGAFTGADKRSAGVFEQADGGTLFLDEIGEMPLPLQVRLLRVLEDARFRRLGGSEDIEADVRIVAATNRAPEAAVADGHLREDLFHRLSVFPIPLPPLRERGDDVLLLAENFLNALGEREGTRKRLTHRALDALRRAPWTGNVRELKNAVERAWILSDDEIDLGAFDLAGPAATDAPMRSNERAGPDAEVAETVTVRVGEPLAHAERAVIEATLAFCEGNKRKTARTLGVSVKTLYNRLKTYEEADAQVSPPEARGA